MLCYNSLTLSLHNQHDQQLLERKSAAVIKIQAMYRGWAVRRAMARAKVISTTKMNIYITYLIRCHDISGQELQKGQKEVVKGASIR